MGKGLKVNVIFQLYTSDQSPYWQLSEQCMRMNKKRNR